MTVAVANIGQGDVIAIAADLDGKLDDGAWIDVLAYANQVNLAQVGGTDQDSRMARIFLAAHVAKTALLARSGAAGPVTSESVGGVRRSYGFIAGQVGTGLASTRYGQMYLDVLAGTGAYGPFVL